MKRRATPTALLTVVLLAATVLAACGEAGVETSTATAALEGQRGGMSAAASPEIADSPLAGELVVPLATDGSENYKLHLVRFDGSAPERLTPEESEITGGETYPAWSPDGRQLVFAGYTDDGVDLFTINADGSELRNLTNNPGHYIQPSWSPDGTRILFTLTTGDGSRIGLLNLTDERIEVRTESSAYDSSPIWSPTGDRIAFLRHESGPCKNIPPPPTTVNGQTIIGDVACDGDPITTLYMMQADGFGLTSLAVLDSLAEDPRWSPDSEKIALTRYETFRENQRIIVVMADGSGVADLTDNHADSSLPRWSPDGSRLSVEIIESGGSEAAINVMNADGTGLQQLTQLRGWHAWSPDGSHLVIQRALTMSDASPSGRSNLYIIDANGQDQRLLLENAAIGTFPAWRPQ